MIKTSSYLRDKSNDPELKRPENQMTSRMSAQSSDNTSLKKTAKTKPESEPMGIFSVNYTKSTL